MTFSYSFQFAKKKKKQQNVETKIVSFCVWWRLWKIFILFLLLFWNYHSRIFSNDLTREKFKNEKYSFGAIKIEMMYEDGHYTVYFFFLATHVLEMVQLMSNQVESFCQAY